NHPQSCAVDVSDAEGDGDTGARGGDGADGAPWLEDAEWREIVPVSPLGPHARHVFDVTTPHEATHLRLRIHPDGGVARLRAYGRVTDAGWRQAGVRWLDTAGAPVAAEALAFCCGSRRW